MKRVIAISAAVVGVVIVGFGLNYVNRVAQIGTGYKALTFCNEVFLAGRTEQDVAETEFFHLPSYGNLIDVRVDRNAQEVTSWFGPFGKRRAVFRPGYGCTVVMGQLAELPPMPAIEPKPWSSADPSKHGFDTAELEAALDEVFENPVPKSRAIVVIKGGELVAEGYAPGFDRAMPMLSNSMAKSVTEMMVGAAVQEGLLTLDDPAPLEEWSGSNDPRREITWRDMLQMQTGLEFEEVYTSPLADVAKMYFSERSAAEFAINKPLIYEPGTHWAYATGTSNILQRALRIVLEKNGIDYHTFGRDRIFAPLGMSSAAFATDPVGDFIGGSTFYATARDWAKLGQLHLQDGVWEGKRILPEGWSDFVSTPASASGDIYGGQVWLNLPRTRDGRKFFPVMPDQAYWFSGYLGQVVLIVPSLDMVFVHLGREFPDRELAPVNKALDLIMSALEQENAEAL